MPLTFERIDQHFAGESQVGLYIFRGDETRLEVIDLDDHDGSVGWNDLTEVADKVKNIAAIWACPASRTDLRAAKMCTFGSCGKVSVGSQRSAIHA